MKCRYDEQWDALFSARFGEQGFDEQVEEKLGPHELARRGWAKIFSPEGEEFYVRDPKARSGSDGESLERIRLIEEGQLLGLDGGYLLELGTGELKRIVG